MPWCFFTSHAAARSKVGFKLFLCLCLFLVLGRRLFHKHGLTPLFLCLCLFLVLGRRLSPVPHGVYQDVLLANFTCFEFKSYLQIFTTFYLWILLANFICKFYLQILLVFGNFGNFEIFWIFFLKNWNFWNFLKFLKFLKNFENFLKFLKMLKILII